jgi:putative addiction module component (TIGR02574 family)
MKGKEGSSPMSVNQVLNEVLAQPSHIRAFIAEKLLESLDHEEGFAVSEEWLAEVQRRAREIDDGLVKLIPAEQVFAELRRRFA